MKEMEELDDERQETKNMRSKGHALRSLLQITKTLIS